MTCRYDGSCETEGTGAKPEALTAGPRTLPGRPSSLLWLAAATAEMVRKGALFPSPSGYAYAFCRGGQHTSVPERKTVYVNMVGCVMALHLSVPAAESKSPHDFDAETESKLKSIGSMQTGGMPEGVWTDHWMKVFDIMQPVTVASNASSDGYAGFEVYAAAAEALSRAGY